MKRRNRGFMADLFVYDSAGNLQFTGDASRVIRPRTVDTGTRAHTVEAGARTFTMTYTSLGELVPMAASASHAPPRGARSRRRQPSKEREG
jgi:hypothetical protein